jgi:hypothetical protein
LPPSGSDWRAYALFATTFDAPGRFGSTDACGELADWALGRWRRTGELPSSLDELRACLFFEQRRWRFQGGEPSPEVMRWVSALVAEMRWHVRPVETQSGEPQAGPRHPSGSRPCPPGARASHSNE